MAMENAKEKNEILGWAKVIGIAILLAFGTRFFLFNPVAVEGASMMPTLEDGDKVIVSKIGPKHSYWVYQAISFWYYTISKRTTIIMNDYNH